MRAEQLGDGTPEIAVVGGIHGDEPCGVRAVERLIEEQPTVERPVKLIVANEPAVERGVRYVNADLNRAFPGDLDADAYERRLAARLAEELSGCVTLALHSTQSHAEPFAVIDTPNSVAREILTATGALPGDTVTHRLPTFRLHHPIPKRDGDEYEVFIENFTRVEAGETFAAVDGEPVTAEEPFYPVLVSPYGYRNVFGYVAEKVGVL